MSKYSSSKHRVEDFSNQSHHHITRNALAHSKTRTQKEPKLVCVKCTKQILNLGCVRSKLSDV